MFTKVSAYFLKSERLVFREGRGSSRVATVFLFGFPLIFAPENV